MNDETTRAICAGLLVIGWTLRFWGMTWTDFYGTAARKPGGMPGFTATVLISAWSAALLYGAGILDAIVEGIR